MVRLDVMLFRQLKAAGRTGTLFGSVSGKATSISVPRGGTRRVKSLEWTRWVRTKKGFHDRDNDTVFTGPKIQITLSEK